MNCKDTFEQCKSFIEMGSFQTEPEQTGSE